MVGKGAKRWLDIGIFNLHAFTILPLSSSLDLATTANVFLDIDVDNFTEYKDSNFSMSSFSRTPFYLLTFL